MYVELNPVRAGLKNNPADYQFTTWGRYCGSGQHMFYDNFVKHLKQNIRTAGDPTQWSDNELFAYFRGELARIIAMESGADTVEIHQAQQQAKRGESMADPLPAPHPTLHRWGNYRFKTVYPRNRQYV